jgi:hypothetical protein
VDHALAHRDLSVLTALARLGARDPVRLAEHETEVAHVFEALLRAEQSHAREIYLALLRGTARGALRATLDKLLEERDMSAIEMIRKEMKAEAKAEGKAEGGASAVLKVLRARGIDVEQTVEKRIRDTRDLELLDRWLVRAVTAATASEVVAD